MVPIVFGSWREEEEEDDEKDTASASASASSAAAAAATGSLKKRGGFPVLTFASLLSFLMEISRRRRTGVKFRPCLNHPLPGPRGLCFLFSVLVAVLVAVDGPAINQSIYRSRLVSAVLVVKVPRADSAS